MPARRNREARELFDQRWAAVESWARGRPLAWFADMYGGKDVNWAKERRDDDKLLTLLHSIDPTRGCNEATSTPS